MMETILKGWVVGLVLLLTGCVSTGKPGEIRGSWMEPRLDEASGLVVLPGSEVLVSHNDDTDNALYLADAQGNALGRLDLPALKNRDWEDLALIRRDGASALVVIGEIGDNAGVHDQIFLHLVEIDRERNTHSIVVSFPVIYPDGPRDAESLAWDPVEEQMLILSKRDTLARLYSVNLPENFSPRTSDVPLTAKFLGELGGIPAPTAEFISRHPRWGQWSAQPTAMDIDAEGKLAAVLTYNDLYLYSRTESQNWAEALQGEPTILDIRMVGQTEAVAFSSDGKTIFIVPEGKNPTLLQVEVP